MRGVKTARVKLGSSWLVLVQPTKSDNPPAEYLDKHGEGVFLISLGTDDLNSQLERWATSSNQTSLPLPRKGLENWTVADLPPDEFFGAQLQLTEEVSD